MPDVHLAVVSSGRSPNVPAMQAHLTELAPTWYVPEGQGGDYRYCGAAEVVEVAWPQQGDQLGVPTTPQAWQRNAALDAGFARGATVVMTDDDLARFEGCHGNATNARWPLPAVEAVQLLADHLASSGAYLAGIAPTTNALFARRAHTVDGFVRANLTAQRPNPLRYDPALPLKGDYDLTLQHLATYGSVHRCDHLLGHYRQRQLTTWGGCDYRTPELMAACCGYLLAKWPDVVVPHATRPGEVTLRWR